MKALSKSYGELSEFSKLEVISLSSFVKWLYAEKDKSWEEFLDLSVVQQNSLMAEFENNSQK